MLSFIFTVIIGINLKCFPDIAPKKIFFLRGAKNVGKHKLRDWSQSTGGWARKKVGVGHNFLASKKGVG